jgi:hypothetical protein
MARNRRNDSVAGTLRWFAFFAIAYLGTVAIVNLILDRPMLGSMVGSAIGIIIVLFIALWLRHWRKR